MDSDDVAVAIAMRLKDANIKFKMLASGREIGPDGKPIWDCVVVDAWDPVRQEFTRLTTIRDADKFFGSR